MFPAYERIPRSEPETISVDRRVGVTEIEKVFSRTSAQEQAHLGRLLVEPPGLIGR